MKSPPPLSPLQTPLLYLSSTQKVRRLDKVRRRDKSAGAEMSEKHFSFVCIGAVIIIGLFPCAFVKTSLLPQPLKMPSVTLGSFSELQRQIGWM